MPLETEATAEIRALVADLKPDHADMLEALHRVQHHYGYVSQEAMHVIAEQLRVTPAHVYGVTTYYSDFRTTPPPQVTVAWCSGPACRLQQRGRHPRRDAGGPRYRAGGGYARRSRRAHPGSATARASSRPRSGSASVS